MAFKHGITTSESPTSVIAAVTTGVTPVYVGTAPINMCVKHNINEPILCYSYAEAVENFGFSNDFEKFTLCEAIDAHFSKFGMAPIVLINVLDSKAHIKKITDKTVIKTKNTYKIPDLGVLPATVSVTGYVNLIKQFDDDGYLLITPVYETKNTEFYNPIIKTVDLPLEIKVSYDMLDTSLVTTEHIIGGVDMETGKKKGLEVVSNIFPKYRVIPNLVLAPKFSTDSAVAAVMETKASLINGHFKGMALVDIDTAKVKKYSDAPAEKNSNNLISTHLCVNYPKVALGDKQYHLSTQVACVIQDVSSKNGDIPYKSPSNKSLKADRACLANGENVLLGPDEANYLNGNGITTALNFIGGWKSWGNRTGCYPDVTDPKDSFIPSRLMFNWLTNSLVLTYWQKVDEPTNKLLIKTVTDSINIWLNGLVNQGALLGARVEFREEDNPLTSLIDGKIKFRVYFTPPAPAEEIHFIQELDVNYYNTLFG
ncbi:MAG: phage tail sheath family protein [Fusobacteriaceae bacterium]